MLAPKKMEDFGLKQLAAATGRDLVTIYRWKNQLARGSGINDANKLALIRATAASEHAISWVDFQPSEDAVASVAGQ